MKKEQIIQIILQNLKANNVYISGELFLSLAFRSRSELLSICNEAGIALK